MKNLHFCLAIVIILFSSSTFGQTDCQAHLKIEKDDFEGTTSTSTKLVFDDKQECGISVIKPRNDVPLYLAILIAASNEWVSEDSKAIFLFENQERVRADNEGDFSVHGGFWFAIGPQYKPGTQHKDVYEKMKMHKLKGIRLQVINNTKDFYFEKKSEVLINRFLCLIEETEEFYKSQGK